MYNNGNSSKNVTGSSIVDGTVETVDIADDAVTADKLANSVNTDIADGVAGKAVADLALPKAGGTMTGPLLSPEFRVGSQTATFADSQMIQHTNAWTYLQGSANGLQLNNNSTRDSTVIIGDDNNILFIANNAERMRILPTGGITFNGDTAAANALDDYEEGTWTPAAGDGVTTFVHTSQLGEYVKVGKQVTVSCAVKWSGIGSVGSGLFRITGLPFPFSSTTGTRYGAALGNVKEVNNNGGQLVLAGDNGVSHISFYSIHDNATYIAVAANSNDNVAGFAQFSATYLTD
jgi:hypothetical protein